MADESAATIRHQIKSIGGAVLFDAEIPADTPSGLIVRAALERATEARANLRGAYLRGADLSGADLSGKKLVGERPILQIGPIGSRADYLVAYVTEDGVKLSAGCFFGTVSEFERSCAETHGDNQHAREYKAALVLIAVHADLWTPKVEAPAVADVAVEE